MLNNPKRRRRFMLPAAVATVFAVAFVTLPVAMADEPAATETMSPSVASETPSQNQVESSAAPAASSTANPSSETPQAESSSTPSNPAVAETIAPKAAATPTQGPSASPSPSALPTPSATFSERIVELQQSKALVASELVANATVQIGVPDRNPNNEQAKLIVSKGGYRFGNTTDVSALEGATFNFYQATSASALTGNTVAGTCTTDESGKCGVIVDLPKSKNNYFFAAEISTPSGWSNGVTWGSDDDLIRYNTGALQQAGKNKAGPVSNLPGTGRTWPNILENPDAPQKCGIKMAVVYDLSNSVARPAKDKETNPTLMSKYRAAGVKFVEALTGTPSSIAVHTFASTAPAQNSSEKSSNNASMSLTSVAQANDAQLVKNKINGLGAVSDPQTGGTNWDRGLSQVGEGYDVVLFLTDGEPTFYGAGNDGGNNQASDLRKVEESIHSANKIKASGAKVIAVGIGSDVSSKANVQRLKLISGPNPGSDYFTTGFDELGTKLTELATANCEGTVSVVKSIQNGNDASSTTPGIGWTFETSTEQVTTDTGAAGKTDANGVLNFVVAGYSQDLSSRTVTIAEKQQPGYELVQKNGFNATCTNLSANGANVAVKNTTKDGFTLDVPQRAAISCKVVNRKLPASISIVKSAAGYNDGNPVTGPDKAPNVPSGTKVTWTYTVTNTGEVPLKNVVVIDDQAGTATCPKKELAAKEQMFCKATGPVSAQ